MEKTLSSRMFTMALPACTNTYMVYSNMVVYRGGRLHKHFTTGVGKMTLQWPVLTQA